MQDVSAAATMLPLSAYKRPIGRLRKEKGEAYSYKIVVEDTDSSIVSDLSETNNFGNSPLRVKKASPPLVAAPPQLVHELEQESREDASLDRWTIQVLDDNDEEETEGEQISLWFRVYSELEEDYVYYQDEEIIDYIRDIIEFQGRSSFALKESSRANEPTLIGANEIVKTLRELITASKRMGRC